MEGVERASGARAGPQGTGHQGTGHPPGRSGLWCVAAGAAPALAAVAAQVARRLPGAGEADLIEVHGPDFLIGLHLATAFGIVAVFSVGAQHLRRRQTLAMPLATLLVVFFGYLAGMNAFVAGP
jgi:hypothetical protein